MFCCRFREATHRTTRWLDRCIAAHKRPEEQNLFAIVQGGLDPELRDISLRVSFPCINISATYISATTVMEKSASQGQKLKRLIPFVMCMLMWSICMQDLKARETPGFAIGGLAGGEDKESFCR